MDAGTCNGSVQFENYAYNMSGVTTEHSEMGSTTIQGESHLTDSYNNIEYANDQYDDYELQDVEIIAIDPNSFYSESTSSSSSESSSESDEEINQEELQNLASTSFNAMPFEMPPSNDDFDIITLNIDEEFPMDPQVDDILFKNDHQFDLASYIGGESTSFLLSPLNDASARRRLMSLSDFGHLDNHHTPVKVKNINIIDKSRIQSNVVQTNAVHDKVAKTPASNRRKRKNLSREFIESSDSDTDKETSTTQNSINHVGDDSKRNKLVKSRKNDDPVWCPDKHNGKTIKQVANCLKEVIDSAESKKNIKISPPPPIQGNSLRNMLKQQLLSDRPVNKNKLLKTMSMPFGSTELSIKPKMVSHPVKRIGVGRGKDIQITAKYYNVNELSDNERDKNCKQDRFHQIYTDSDTTSESSESDSETDDSDIEVNSEPSPPSKDIIKEKKPLSIIEIDTNKGKQHENNFERKISAEELVKKPIDSKAKINDTNKPTAIDNNSMDSTDFAKALVTNAKIASKTKITKLKKNNNLEQQKRIIQSNLLLQNPAKFTMFSIEKNKSSLNGHLSSSSSGISSSEMKSSSSATESKVIEIKTVQVTPKKIEKVPIKSVENKPDKKIETESLENNEKTTSNIEIEVVKVVNENPLIQEDVKPDVVYVEENKIESCAKRKLNIQEYLKRKSFKTFHNGESGARNDFIMNIKTERTENGKKIDSNQENNCNDEEDAPIFAGNSMYEEIIIVSMGCNTDISIPEASFIQTSETMDMKSTVLLSDIQTSVEKANSKISCMSLISSIQDTILKKTHSIEQNGKKETGTDTDGPDGKKKETPEHGENKVIMHLRKDRVRPMRMSTSVQTDPYFQFPPLQKLAPLSKKPSTMVERRMGSIPRDNRNEMHYSHSENKNRAHRNYRGKSHLSESSYYSDEDDKLNQRRSRHSEFMEHNNSRQRRARRESSRYSSSKYDRYISRHRTISRSLSSSSDNSTTSTDSSSSSQSSSSSSSYVSNTSERSLNSYGGSSSKSYYGDDHQYYRKRTTSNNSRHSNFRPVNSNRANSPEERRIVYVGRVEEETTKEELRRKFSVYGQVKQVSLHYKETKMKYGFITFVRPGDAYTAIDDSSKNSAICHYDVSFGGRRAFCREKYFDLDNSGTTTYHDDSKSTQKPVKENDDSFEALLRKVKEKLEENKK